MAKVLQQPDGLITFDIKIRGSRIPDVIEVQEIHIDMEINRITCATVVIQDGGAIGVTNTPFDNSEGKLFLPGNDIEILLGYDNKRETAFKGIVVSQRLRVKNDYSQLVISCKDKAFGMTKGRYNAIFQDKKDSDAIQSVAKKYSGVKIKVDSTTGKMPTIMQYNCSDWDFVLMRAEANNMIVTTHQNEMSIQKVDFGKEAKYEVNTSQFVKDIDLNLNGEQLIPSVDLTAWDDKEQQDKSVQVKISDTLAQGNLKANKIASSIGNESASIYSSAALTDGEMKLIGESILFKTIISKIEGKVMVPGTTTIVAGDIIELSGFSNRFNGKAFITGLQHSLERGNWFTTLYIGAPKKFHASYPDVMDTPASGVIPATNGIQIATVKKIHEDPENDFRVLITLPSFSGEGQLEGLWARLAFPYASKDAGFFFFPEVNDEVLVTFINNDPRFPVITGALYSAKNTPKEIPDEKNKFKSIFSKSGIQIRFDDEDKILNIETPEGNCIILDDKEKSIIVKDANSNTLTLDDSGISLESVKDIKLSAKGDIKLDATGKVSLNAKGDLTGDGTNVSLSAKTGFTAKGNASAELSASGQTTVKGAMVMIN